MLGRQRVTVAGTGRIQDNLSGRGGGTQAETAAGAGRRQAAKRDRRKFAAKRRIALVVRTRSSRTAGSRQRKQQAGENAGR